MRWRYGICSKLGPRSANEDRLVAIPNLVEVMRRERERQSVQETERQREKEREKREKERGSDVRCGIGIEARNIIGMETETGMGTILGVEIIQSSMGMDMEIQGGRQEGRQEGRQGGRQGGMEIETEIVEMDIRADGSGVSVVSAAVTDMKGDGLGSTGEKYERHAYFAVYDGHCGAHAASHLQETLHLSIFSHPLYHSDIQTAIIESCVATDRAFLRTSRERREYSGSTALGAIVRGGERGSELTVFNIGVYDCCSSVLISPSSIYPGVIPNSLSSVFLSSFVPVFLCPFVPVFPQS